MQARKLMGGSAEEKLYVDDVFSTYLYTGNGSTQTINNGIDLAGEGGMVWIKNRSAATKHDLFDTVRGYTSQLSTVETDPAYTQAFLSGFTNSGFSTLSSRVNDVSSNFVSWTFRKAPKFFDVQTATLSSGNATVSFTDLETLGMVIVKRTDSTGSWYVWHRSLTAGKLMYLEQTAAEATLGHITVSGTTLTLVDGTLADGNYVCYAFAHDTATDGIVQCGSFTGDGGAGGFANVELGWEPQYLLVKKVTSSDGTPGDNWQIFDNMCGGLYSHSADGKNTKRLYANTAAAEQDILYDCFEPTSTGFRIRSADIYYVNDYIYLAIRRPNKPPTSGTQVYNAIARTGTGAAATVTTGFAADCIFAHMRNAANEPLAYDKLRGLPRLMQSNTLAEVAATTEITGYTNTGYTLGIGSYINQSDITFIDWVFRRAPGFFDVVCYTGTGSARTVNHNLGAVPELIIVKCRSNASSYWKVSVPAILTSSYILFLNDISEAVAASGNFTSTLSDTVFGVGGDFSLNYNTYTYVAYLFATLPGISKVGSYTGNGSSQTINCGFSAGARFVLIKRTDSTGDWYVWDSVRGIVAANDPHLSLNTSSAEVTTDDSVDPDNSGFIVNQVAATNINVTSATYIYLAIA